MCGLVTDRNKTAVECDAIWPGRKPGPHGLSKSSSRTAGGQTNTTLPRAYAAIRAYHDIWAMVGSQSQMQTWAKLESGVGQITAWAVGGQPACPNSSRLGELPCRAAQ